MRLLIARHAQTQANREMIILGRRDSPPTKAGLIQCRKLAALMHPEGTGIIISSPLGRATATAGIFAAASGWSMEAMDNLTELSCGEWEGQPRLSVLPPGRPLRLTWADTPGGGESYTEAAKRVKKAIHRLKQLPYDHILVVGHAAVNQVFLKILLSLDPQESLAIQHPHDLLYKIESLRVSWLNSTGATGEGLLIKK